MLQNEIIEIRGHARGGQGMVTAFEILAKIFSKANHCEVQAFPFFGVERTGAPIQAFLRLSLEPILNRSNIYQPGIVVVFDEGLLDQVPVFEGLLPGGTALINTEKTPNNIPTIPAGIKTIYTLPANKISINKGLGNKALPIVNAAMIGAIIKILNGNIRIASNIIKEEVPAKPNENAEAAKIAYDSLLKHSLQIPEYNNVVEKTRNPPESFRDKTRKVSSEVPFAPYWDQPLSLNKTGNWRMFTPHYVNRTSPCTANCPAGTDVRQFVKYAAEKKFKEAFETIYTHNPFPASCGRVCPHFCQQNCNRKEFDSLVNIGAIERFIGDFSFTLKRKKTRITRNEKIAVIGSGPAGLTAALRLRQQGFPVTVFETYSKAGGMMRVGIPGFRNPEDVLDNEIQRIKDEGVEMILNKKVTLKEMERNFSAVIAATGLHTGSKMNIPNEHLAMDGIRFLYETKMNNNFYNIRKGDKIAVIGGGNTAVDVARTLLRLGGKPTLYYRRTRTEMPAISHEVDEALSEGVQIEFLSAPVKIEKGLKCLRLTILKMTMGDPDESGRRKPVPVKGSEKTISTDRVITAIGQENDNYFFSGQRLKIHEGKTECHSKIPLFCCGDISGGGTVTEAIGSGNRIALEVLAYMNHAEYSLPVRKNNAVLPDEMKYVYYKKAKGNSNPVRKKSSWHNDFSEVVQGLTRRQTVEEAARCLHCGECFLCGNCFNFCPDAAISLNCENQLRASLKTKKFEAGETEKAQFTIVNEHFEVEAQRRNSKFLEVPLKVNYDYCKGCAVCAQECPCGAITMR